MTKLAVSLLIGGLAASCAQRVAPIVGEPRLPEPVVATPVPKPAKALPAPVAAFTVKDNKIELPGPVLFEEDSAVLRRESDGVLEVVYRYLVGNPQVSKLRIEGHTDGRGNPAHNLKLSEDRALTVAHWLVAKGVDCRRLIPVGFGQTRPAVSPEKSDADRDVNRRVDFINAEINGEAIGGMPIDGGAERHGDPCK